MLDYLKQENELSGNSSDLSDNNGQLTMRYVPLSKAIFWENNPKLHEIGALVESIKAYGFRDAPIYDNTLGAFVAGNGRTIALQAMKKVGNPAPKGIVEDKEGEWWLPIQFGIDADSIEAAEAFGIDHNNLTMLGGDADINDLKKIWELDKFIGLAQSLTEAGQMIVSLDTSDIDYLIKDAKITAENTDNSDVLPDDRLTEAEELMQSWGTKQGQLWIIPGSAGEHRLLCEDGLVDVNIHRITDRYDFVWADPTSTGFKIISSDTGRTMFSKAGLDYNEVYAKLVSIIDCDSFIGCNWESYPNLVSKFGNPRSLIVLAKAIASIRTPKDFMGQHEFIAYYGIGVDTETSDMWDEKTIVGNKEKNYNRGQKPVSVIVKALSFISGEIILDPFAGASPCIMACELSGKIGRALEPNPAQVAISLQRFVDYGMKPYLEEENA